MLRLIIFIVHIHIGFKGKNGIEQIARTLYCEFACFMGKKVVHVRGTNVTAGSGSNKKTCLKSKRFLAFMNHSYNKSSQILIGNICRRAVSYLVGNESFFSKMSAVAQNECC